MTTAKLNVGGDNIRCKYSGVVLLVDDSDHYRHVIQRQLVAYGYDVLLAANGVEAIKMVNYRRVDLVLLDIEMPGLDGFSVLAQFRAFEKSQDLPVIMLTGRSDAADVIRALRLGANDYALKPVEIDVLVSRIQTHLKLSSPQDQTLGSYTLLRKIGEGAMSHVYEALCQKTKRRSAVKVLHRSLTIDETNVIRFREEAELMQRLEHKHIVKCYGMGQDGETYYLAMEFVEGPTLEKWSKGKAMESREVLVFAQQIALALDHLDDMGVLHRDIKPQNIMCTQEGVIKIADFGIALDESRDNRLTQEGIAVGSVIYSSPMQLSGVPDSRGDMYSLGCTLFQLLTAKLPFGVNEALASVVRAKEKAPQRVSEVNAAIEPQICDMVYRLMLPDPQSRFKDYKELLTLLEHLLSDGHH
jgi:serine/threonine protein kinase